MQVIIEKIEREVGDPWDDLHVTCTVKGTKILGYFQIIETVKHGQEIPAGLEKTLEARIREVCTDS